MFHARPNLGYTLQEAVGKYEFSVMPRSLFDPTDGSLLLPGDKNEVLNEVVRRAEASVEVRRQEANKYKIRIVDAMATVAKKLRHYNQGRIIFDEYKSGSLKDKTRAKRLDGIQPVEFTVSDETQLKLVPMKLFLSHVKTKAKLVEYLGSALDAKYKDSTYPLITAYNESIHSNGAAKVYTELASHSHEEADTVIPLNVMDITKMHP